MVVVAFDTLTGPLAGTNDDDIFFARTGGIVNADITAEGGNDLIIGRNTNDNGIGINQTQIDAGGGDDEIIALGIGADGIGIVGGTIQLGAGDDVITARGNNVGILDTAIDGGGGDDTFNIEGGTGVIRGGAGDDRLSLPGMMSEYTIIPINDQNNVIEIIGGANGKTNLFVSQVEEIAFVQTDGTTDIFSVEDAFRGLQI